MLLTALKPIATLETSLEANYDTTRTAHGQSDLWGHELLLCPKITELILQHNFLEVLTLIVQGGDPPPLMKQEHQNKSETIMLYCMGLLLV